MVGRAKVDKTKGLLGTFMKKLWKVSVGNYASKIMKDMRWWKNGGICFKLIQLDKK